jgi:hypothetical protein
MGMVHQTLFLPRQGKDILIVQVYVDDIIFGGSSNSLVARFVEDMSRKFDMSMMGELQFFLRPQIKQSKEGTFVHQAKYTKDIVRKFKMDDSKAMEPRMSTTTTLKVDEEGEHVDQKEYQNLIGSFLYLTTTRPDIQFSVCLCARFQPSPRTSHWQGVKRIFKYFRHTPDFGVWYSASSSLVLHGFSDADFAVVGWIGTPIPGLPSFWDRPWCLGLPANSRVLLTPLPRQSMLPQLVVRLTSFGSHIP